MRVKRWLLAGIALCLLTGMRAGREHRAGDCPRNILSTNKARKPGFFYILEYNNK